MGIPYFIITYPQAGGEGGLGGCAKKKPTTFYIPPTAYVGECIGCHIKKGTFAFCWTTEFARVTREMIFIVVQNSPPSF